LVVYNEGTIKYVTEDSKQKVDMKENFNGEQKSVVTFMTW